MSKLSSFLKENVKEGKRSQEVFVSDRFSEPITIKLLSPKELARCQDAAVSIKNKKPFFDTKAYNMELIKLSITDPDLKSAELQDSYGVMNEEDLINEMFTGAEFTKISTEVNEFNSLDEDINDKINEAKN